MSTKGTDLAYSWNFKVSKLDLGNFGTIRDYWRVANNMDYLLAQLPSNVSIVMSKEESDTLGCACCWKVTRVSMRHVFKKIATALVAEYFADLVSFCELEMRLDGADVLFRVQTLSSREEIPQWEILQRLRSVMDLPLDIPIEVTSNGSKVSSLSQRFSTAQYSLRYMYEVSSLPECQELPLRWNSVQWDKLKRNDLSLGSLMLDTSYSFRRHTWPHPFVESPMSWSRLGTRRSKPPPSIADANDRRVSNETGFSMSTSDAADIDDTVLDEIRMEGSTQPDTDLAALQEQLKKYQDTYTVALIDDLEEDAVDVLQEEGCFTCLDTGMDLRFVLVKNRITQAQHIAHYRCLRTQPLPRLIVLPAERIFSISRCTSTSLSESSHATPHKYSITMRWEHVMSKTVSSTMEIRSSLHSRRETSSQREFIEHAFTLGDPQMIQLRRGRLSWTVSRLDSTLSWSNTAQYDIASYSYNIAMNYIDPETRNCFTLVIKPGRVGSSSLLVSLVYTFWNHGSDENVARKEIKAAASVWRTPPVIPAQPSIPLETQRLLDLCTSPTQSRHVMDTIASKSKEARQAMIRDVAPHAVQLAMDDFGGPVLVKMFQFANGEQRTLLLRSLAIHLDKIAQHKQGSSTLQSMMDDMLDTSDIRSLAKGLEQHAVPIIMSSTGHYVMVKFIKTFRPSESLFLIKPVTERCEELCVDHYGLRVIKCLLDVLPTRDAMQLLRVIASLTNAVVENQYGNYVVQHAIEKATIDLKMDMIQRMRGRYVRLSRQKFSSNVVEKCLRSANRKWKHIIVCELCDSISKLIRDRFGNYVLQTAMETADEDEARILIRSIAPHLHTLRDNVRSKWESILDKKRQSLC